MITKSFENIKKNKAMIVLNSYVLAQSKQYFFS